MLSSLGVWASVDANWSIVNTAGRRSSLAWIDSMAT
jgi:hypothetical protein